MQTKFIAKISNVKVFAPFQLKIFLINLFNKKYLVSKNVPVKKFRGIWRWSLESNSSSWYQEYLVEKIKETGRRLMYRTNDNSTSSCDFS